MEALIAGASSLFSSIGGIAGVTGAGAASAGAGILSSVVTGIAGISAANYQASIATRAAKIHEENAQRIVAAGQKEAKMQDEAAAAQIADDIASQGASGFALSSPSFVRRRAKMQVLAGQDRENIIEDSRVQAASEREAGYSARVEASQARSSALFKFIGMGINVFDSAIGGANLSGSIASRRVRSSSYDVAYT